MKCLKVGMLKEGQSGFYSVFHFSLKCQANITLFHKKIEVSIEKLEKFRSDFAFFNITV